MIYSIFRNFCDLLILKIDTENRLDSLKRLQQLKYENLTDHFYSYLENDLVRLLYKEYEDMKIDDPENKKDSMNKFLSIIQTEKFLNDLLEKYPLFSSMLQQLLNDYVSYIKEVYDNFFKDIEGINRHILQDVNQIIDISTFQGDLHNGRSVCKVITNSGVIYYKPMNSDTQEMFNKVYTFIKRNMNSNEDNIVKFYSTKDHMWTENIESKTCEDKKQVNRYYYNAGIELLIFYLLGSYDMHFENIINCADHPTIIDYETIALAPKMKVNDYTTFRENELSVLNSAFIPFKNEKGSFDVIMSGILSKSTYSESDENIYYLADEKGFFINKGKSYIQVMNEVTLHDEPVLNHSIFLNDIKDLLIKGFKEAAKVAIEKKEGLFEIYRELSKIEHLKIRQLLRPTQVYYKFIEATRYPSSLTNQNKTDEVLLLLEGNFIPSDFGYIRVQEEISQIKKGYIPVFHAELDSLDLYSYDKIICKNYFPDTIINMINKKLEKLDDDLVHYQTTLIEYSMLLLTNDKEFVKTTNNSFMKESDIKIDKDYVNTLIEQYIHELSNKIIRLNEDIINVLVPHLVGGNVSWQVDGMKINLYEDGGIILLLAYYGKAVGDGKYVSLASEFLNSIAMNYSIQENYSVYSGLGSLVYLYYNLLQILSEMPNQKMLYKKNHYMYEKVLKKSMDYLKNEDFKVEDYDFLNGSVSTIYLLCKMYLENQDQKLLDDLCLLKDKMKKNFNLEKYNEVGFGHGLTGQALVFAYLYKVTGDSEIYSIVNRILQKEDSLISTQGIRNLRNTWCRGISGIVLGRYLICEILNEKSMVFEEYKEVFLEKMQNEQHENYCLCHGLYGNFEILMKVENRKTYQEMFQKKYFNSFEDLQWIEGLDIPINLFMTGNGGIAYALLEMIYKFVPNILALDLYKID